jgi:heme/copper-type cytochrome/quinol oxidase subunit 1
MTTIDTHADAAGDSVVASISAGVADWVTSTDHKKIGRLYLGFGLIGLLGATVLGALFGLERMNESELLARDSLVQLIQTQRVALVFGGLIPLALGLAIAIVPLQLGARQLAFPRVALTGLYAWLGGLVLTLVALGRNGGIGGGDAAAVDLFLSGIGLMILGVLASAGTVATTVLTTRAPGMTMWRVPFFSWSALIGSISMLLALPVAFGMVVYLFIDHRLGLSENFGGAEGIGPWLGWLLSVPAAIVFCLPALGVAAEMVPVTFKARQPVRGAVFTGIALTGIAAAFATITRQSFLDVGQDAAYAVSLDTGQTFGEFLEGLLPFLLLAGVPVLGVLIVMALGGLTAKNGASRGRPNLTSAFVLSFLGLGMIFVGIVGHLLLAVSDLEVAGTTLEEGAVLYVAYGAAMAVFGGVAFWAPKLWGRTLPEKLVYPLALLALVGTVLASLPMYIAGFLNQVGGLPANDTQLSAVLSLDYDGSAEVWNILAMLGHVAVLVSASAFVALMVQAFAGRGEPADDNPFGGHTLEWSVPSPAPTTNYEHVPTVASATPVFDLTHEGSRS